MEQQDYLRRQLDRLGQALAKILSMLTGLKDQGQAGQCVAAAYEALSTDAGLVPEHLMGMPADDLLNHLKERHFSNENIRQLADIFLSVADHLAASEPEKSFGMYQRCLHLYQYWNADGKAYSLDVWARIRRIEHLLQDSAPGQG